MGKSNRRARTQAPDFVADNGLINRRALLEQSIALAGVGAGFGSQGGNGNHPIVFMTGLDPVAMSFVPRDNRPGGNLTGASFLSRVLW